MMSDNTKNSKVVLIHDYLDRWGGAEQVFKAFVELFPDAPVFTLTYDKEKIDNFLKIKKVNASFLNRLPKFIKKRKRYLLPLIPSIPETFDLRDFDVVISSSGAFSKGVIVRPDTTHICYCHSPMRFAWDWQLEYKKEQRKGFLTNAAINIMLNYIRIWDFSNSQRVDYFIANSQNIASRIKKYYRRESKIIYPFIEKFEGNQEELISPELQQKKYFLIISQLAPYKKIDLAIEAFNKLGLPLIIAGEGKEKKHLQKIADKNIEFAGFVSDRKKWELIYNSKAMIFPGEDDFGITMAEAALAGKPVLAYRAGGAKEIIEEGITGEFFDYPSVEVLAEGVKRIREKLPQYNTELIKQKAERFSKDRFKKEFLEYFNHITHNT